MSDTTFVPHPGSRTETVARIAGEASKTTVNAAPSVRNPQPVKTRSAVPQDGVWRTMTLQPGETRQLLPQDPNRARAVILVFSGVAVICETQALAQSPNNFALNASSFPSYPDGFLLAQNVQVAIENQGLIWAANYQVSAVTCISVLVERYEQNT